MRDYAKLLILGSTALLVLLAVCLVVFPLLFWPHEGKQPPGLKDDGAETKAPKEISGGTETKDNNTQPPGNLPDTIEFGQEFKLPCSASLNAVVEKYYKDKPVVKLSNGSAITVTQAQLPDVIKRLAKYNNITDFAANLPAGTALKLPRVYIVEHGDTLTTILKKVYGNTSRQADVINQNKEVMPNPNKISIGMILILP